MTLVGLVGLSALLGPQPALAMLGQVFHDNGMSYTLSVMPLFVLMGNFVVNDAWIARRSMKFSSQPAA